MFTLFNAFMALSLWCLPQLSPKKVLEAYSNVTLEDSEDCTTLKVAQLQKLEMILYLHFLGVRNMKMKGGLLRTSYLGIRDLGIWGKHHPGERV